MEIEIESDGLRLRGHVATPPGLAGVDGARRGLVLCHGFPPGPKGAATTGLTYPQLADRLAGDAGWTVLTFNFRGTGESDGDFSIGGWLTDLRAAIDHMLTLDAIDGVWVSGFSVGGSLARRAEGEDDRVRGVATMAAPADFGEWADDPEGFLDHARSIGVVRSKGFPTDFDAWSRELREIRPLTMIGKIPPRPILIIHGSEDDTVPLMDARALADAAEGDVELRVVTGAGHRLRHDPRAVAVLQGWLDRQTL